MKTGLILEGGAMRGMFTAGVLDVFMENNITVDGTVGVSAGAVFGCNYKSRQIGRGLRYNKKYCTNPRYVSFRSWITTGDIYNVDFAYGKLINELDPFDRQAFHENPMEFYVVATDVNNGEAIYYKCDTGSDHDVAYIRASASMPGFSNNVKIDGHEMSDGGTADSIPLKFFERIGYDRNIVVLTRPIDYVKGENKFIPILKHKLKKTPALITALKNRHIHYNETTEYIRKKEEAGEILVIRPEADLGIAKVCRDPEELERVYMIGRQTALKQLEQIRAFLSK